MRLQLHCVMRLFVVVLDVDAGGRCVWSVGRTTDRAVEPWTEPWRAWISCGPHAFWLSTCPCMRRDWTADCKLGRGQEGERGEAWI